MRPRLLLTAMAVVLAAGISVQLAAQGPPPGRGAGAGGRGGGRGQATFPAQQRPPGDPAVIARGKILYEINCRACHGPDLRGGDQGGPNLLRSQTVLNDQAGELIEPIVRTGRQTPGMTPMPPQPLPADDIRAIAEYIHSVAATAQRQGAPPPGQEVELDIVVGNADAGKAYFGAHCSACHSATGDLAGLASRVATPKQMQNLFVSGGGGGRGRGGNANRPEVRVAVTDAGTRVEGRLDQIDDFLVVLTTDAGERRSFARRGAVPQVEVEDPLAGHIDLLSVYTDTDIHDVTAYLVTLK